MNNQQQKQNFRERVWRHPLAPEHEAELRATLAGQPEEQADFELEAALTQALGRLSDAPVSNNFTSRVVAAAERKLAEERRRRRWSWHRLWRERWRWLPHTGLAAFLLAGAWFSYDKIQTAQQVRTIESLATVAEVASVPGPENLRDFDAIRALSAAPAADVELLMLLQ